jgi:GNAT superfamily N-acetyltransferase
MSETIHTRQPGFILRTAEEKDTTLILYYIKSLAAYEKLSTQVEATEESLRRSIFELKRAEAVIAEFEGQPVGYMLFFYNYSTFHGKAGIYVEDIYVEPNMRGRGFGKIMFAYLAWLTEERECARLEWACLNWNKPSIGFYTGLGAIPMDEWKVYRLHRDSLHKLAEEF